MHNSFMLRERLAALNRHPLCVARRAAHRGVMADPEASVGAGEFDLTRSVWQIGVNAAPEVAEVVRADLADFLSLLGVRVAGDEAAASGQILFALDPVLGPRDCRLNLQPGLILVAGGAVSGLWAGVAWLEWEMRTRRGPFLPVGMFSHGAAWPVQISQGPWGGNYSVPDFAPEFLSDESLCLYAHYGITSMMIYGDLLCYTDGAVLPELNHPQAAAHLAGLAAAAQRAARYGVQFTYVVVGPKLRATHPVFAAHPTVRGAGLQVRSDDGILHVLCASEPLVQRFYEETFRRLFTVVPDLAGVVLITFSESMYHCRMWEKHAVAPCPRCTPRTVNEVVGDLVGAVARGVKDAQPDAFVAEWIYTWQGGPRAAAFRSRPPEVAIMQHQEKDGTLLKTGYRKHLWDYSVEGLGPNPDLLELAALAHDHDSERHLYIKTETGTGLETMQVPYVPALPHLALKWQRVRAQRPRGVHQSWLFFGMCGSRAEQLGWWAAYGGEQPADEFLHQLAVRDFGPVAAPKVLQAWGHMSRAVTHLPCILLTYYYVGPSFLGPAHPLAPSADAPVPAVFSARLYYLQELGETFSAAEAAPQTVCMVMRALPKDVRELGVTPDDPASDGWDLVADEYAAAAKLALKAWTALQSAAGDTRTAADAQELADETRLVELLHRTFLTCEHSVRFLQARTLWEQTQAPKARQKLLKLVALERANALAAKEIYTASPWLDIAMRSDGEFASSLTLLDAKIAWLDEAYPPAAAATKPAKPAARAPRPRKGAR